MANFTIIRNGLNTEIVGDPHIGQSSEDVTVAVNDDGTYSGYAKRLYYSYCYHNELHRALSAVNSNNEFIIPVQAFFEPGMVKLSVELSNGTNCPACNACFLIVTDGAKDVDTSVLPSEKTWQSYIQSYIKSDVNALEKRIDNLILSSGTESSAEVIDARTGYDGTSYDTLGTAIRSQVGSLKNDLSNLGYFKRVSYTGDVWHGKEAVESGVPLYFRPVVVPEGKTGIVLYGIYEEDQKDGYDMFAKLKKGESKKIIPSRDYHHLQATYYPFGSGESQTFVFDYIQTDLDGIQTDLDGIQAAVASGHFNLSESGVILDYKGVSAGETYKVYAWNISGFVNNRPGCYLFYRDGTFVSYSAVGTREIIDGTVIHTVNIPENAAYLRLYCNKLADAETASCDYAYIRVSGARLDVIEKKLQNIQENKLNVVSLLNNRTCNIFNKVVCCGDSYTSGHMSDADGVATGTNENYAWPHYMSKLTGNNWVNCGCSGCNVLTWQTHTRGLPAAQTAGKAQAYVIGLMINDVSNSDRAVELGTAYDIGTDAQTYYGGMSAIIRKLNEISPDAKIFVNTCPKTGEKYTTYNQAVRDIVTAYKDTYPVHCIDLEARKDLYSNSSLTSDAWYGHYTAIGYEQFAEIYAYILSQYINEHVSDFQNVYQIEYDA